MSNGTSYTPDGQSGLAFHMLSDQPTRQTQQTMSERIIPGSTGLDQGSVVDLIGKPVTKVRGNARFDSFDGLKTFEGAVGTQGTLVYPEEPGGVRVIFISLERNRVLPPDIHLAAVEFWLMPPGEVVGGP